MRGRDSGRIERRMLVSDRRGEFDNGSNCQLGGVLILVA